MKNFDTYNIRARIAPVFLVFLPLILVSYLSSVKLYTVQALSGSTIFTIALSILAAQFGRDRGKVKEKGLWDKWGGPPTTRFLRHSDTQYNPIRRNRCHNVLKSLLPDINLPTSEEESCNHDKADLIYDACIRYLINRTRNKKEFPLIYSENVNYGFLRNLWGLKPYGICISIMSIIFSILYVLKTYPNFLDINLESFSTIVILILYLGFWIFWVNPNKIKIAAEAYAARLLDYCEQIELK